MHTHQSFLGEVLNSFGKFLLKGFVLCVRLCLHLQYFNKNAVDLCFHLRHQH